MPWARIDDRANSDAKLLALSDSAYRMWVAGLIFCQANLTDGFIPSHAIHTFGVRARKKTALVAELTKSVLGKQPLWQEVENGWTVNDFLMWNESRETVIASRQTAKQRLALFRDPGLRQEVRARDGDVCRYCGRTVRWHDRKGELGGTYDHVKPVGGNGPDNLVVCCRSCNSRKKGRTPEQARMPLLDPKSDVESSSRSRSEQASTTTTQDQNQKEPRAVARRSPEQLRMELRTMVEMRRHLRAACHRLIETGDPEYQTAHPHQLFNLADQLKHIAARDLHIADYDGRAIQKIIDAVLNLRARRSA